MTLSLLSLDARWRRLNDPERACPCCGRVIGGIYDIGFDSPSDWTHTTPKPGQDLEVGTDRLTSELARFQGRYFIRTTLALPIRGSEEVFYFAPWAELPEALFRTYLDSLEGAAFEGGDALLANALPGFEDSLGLACHLRPGNGEERPTLHFEEDPLQAATQGMSFDQLLEIYAAFGDDLRPHLTKD